MTHRPPRAVIAVLGIALVAGLAWVATCGRRTNDGSIVASGTVEATEAQLGFPATGRHRFAGRSRRRSRAARDKSSRGSTRPRPRRASRKRKRDAAAARAGLDELERGSRARKWRGARAALDAAIAAPSRRGARPRAHADAVRGRRGEPRAGRQGRGRGARRREPRGASRRRASPHGERAAHGAHRAATGAWSRSPRRRFARWTPCSRTW